MGGLAARKKHRAAVKLKSVISRAMTFFSDNDDDELDAAEKGHAKQPAVQPALKHKMPEQPGHDGHGGHGLRVDVKITVLLKELGAIAP